MCVLVCACEFLCMCWYVCVGVCMRACVYVTTQQLRYSSILMLDLEGKQNTKRYFLLPRLGACARVRLPA